MLQLDRFENFKLRAWSEFFELNRFKKPDKNNLNERVITNIFYYQANYTLIFGIITFFAILTNPSLLFSVLIIAAAWFYTLYIRKDPFIFNGLAIADQQLYIGLGVASILVLLFTAGLQIFFIFFVGVGVILGHASLRARSMKSKINYKWDTLKGSSPLGGIVRDINQEDPEVSSDEETPERSSNSQATIKRNVKINEEMRQKYGFKKPS